jgi:uncharacterized protein (DUF58 family)
MIVPRVRLILSAAVILPTAGLVAAWRNDWTAFAVAMGAMLVMIAAMDGITRRRQLQSLSVSIPEVVRMTVDKVAQIQVVVRSPDSNGICLRLGLALPPQIVSEQNTRQMTVTNGSRGTVLNWACTALRRGRYGVERCHLEVISKFGFWALRKRVRLNGEIRAYPNLISGQQKLLGLFRRRQWGLRTQRRIGKGREFEQLREYLPGDSFEDIDWKATARRHQPVTRVYQVEQAQEIYVVLDASRLSTRSALFVTDRRRMARSRQDHALTTIFDRYATAALVMSLVADQMSDRYGLLVFSDKPECYIKAGRGTAHYNACRDALYNREPRTVSPDFEELFAYVGTHLRKRSLLVMLTNLDDPVLAQTFIHAMGAAGRQHILMVNMFRPPGAHPLFSIPDIKEIQGIYQHLVGHMIWASLSQTHRHLKQHGAALHLLDEKQLCSQLVSQYMDVKQRQVL